MDLFAEISNALTTEHRVMLATIISTSGSTPASAFSRMLIKDRGKVSIGTVGGGCLEGDVKGAAQRLYESNKAEILSFHLNENEFVQGLICGGNLDVLVEPLDRDDLDVLGVLIRRRNEGEDSVLATLLGVDGKVLLRQVIESEEKILKPLGRLEHHALMIEELHKVFHRNETRRVKVNNGEMILEPILGKPGLIIFGGGHVSKYLSNAASMVGFRVTIVDDRNEYANAKRFPEAEKTLTMEFSEVFEHLTIKPSSYIVIVTRGHQSDEEILEKAIKTPAKYIGMIGSKRKILTTYQHLMERGIGIHELKRVHAPMGIEIGATTAEEIAISITAELIAVRRGERSPYLNKSDLLHKSMASLDKMTTSIPHS